MEFISRSEKETMDFAQNMGKSLKPGSILALFGDLGAGKTTFTKGLAKGLGIDSRITSPTFVLMRDYDLPEKNNAKLHHLDLYRLNSSSEIKSIDLKELVNLEDNIYVIEWAQRASDDELKNAIKVYFEILSETERKITIVNP